MTTVSETMSTSSSASAKEEVGLDELKDHFEELQKKYRQYLPKVDPALLDDLLLRQMENPHVTPMYMVEVFLKPGLNTEEVRKYIISKTGMSPAIYDNGTHYVTNQKLTLEIVKEISDSEEVIEVTGDYTGGLGGYGASHEHTNHENRFETLKEQQPPQQPPSSPEKISNSHSANKTQEKEISEHRYNQRKSNYRVAIYTAAGMPNQPPITLEQVDVAILGGGPAGLQAALVLSRTRKKIVVFDDPEPPRNAASHGVHNFLGLDGLLPADIRRISWQQIDRYASAELRKNKIVDVRKNDDGLFLITDDNGASINARKVILAFGYHDVYPDIPGFLECWADSIISCPFCDGYENRDRTWGIVISSRSDLERFPKLVQNWTQEIKVFISSDMEITSSYEDELSRIGIVVHRGNITKVNHSDKKVQSVSLDSGELVEVNTLFWIPPKRPSPLIQKLVENLGLELDGQDNIKTDEMRQTNVKGLYAAGDVRGPIPIGALAAAYDGGMAASSIVRGWYN